MDAKFSIVQQLLELLSRHSKPNGASNTEGMRRNRRISEIWSKYEERLLNMNYWLTHDVPEHYWTVGENFGNGKKPWNENELNIDELAEMIRNHKVYK